MELRGGYVWIDMLGSTPERQKPFEEVQSDVKAQYLEAERRKAINAARQCARRSHRQG